MSFVKYIGYQISAFTLEFQGYILTPVTGNNQDSDINTAFGTDLSVQITENFANTGLPLENINITFTAPSTGASGSFSGNSSVTVASDATGRATAPLFTANDTTGNFTVTATDGTTTIGNFSLTNIDLTPTITPVTPITPITPTPTVVPTTPTVTLPSNLLALWTDLQTERALSHNICENVPDVSLIVDILDLNPDLQLQDISTNDRQKPLGIDCDAQYPERHPSRDSQVNNIPDTPIHLPES